ncbi:Tuberculostearic acid methyltransferase UfaA1-like protein [Drosera capensis]
MWEMIFCDRAAGLFAARGILGRSYAVLKNSKGMPPSFLETAARFLVIGFLKRFVTAGCILLEDGVSVLRFQGSHEKCPLKVALRVHSAQFYWKFATRGDLGVADAYTDGDFSISDKNEGLLNLFQTSPIHATIDAATPFWMANPIRMKGICWLGTGAFALAILEMRFSRVIAFLARAPKIFIANSYGSTVHEKRGWWWPVLLTTSVATVRYVHHHASRKNTLAQARRNIAYHYDLSNEMFGLFLDETMTYSCGVFKFPDEHLKDAQLRKFSVFVKKAKIMENHEVLEIGCGWGGLAIEVVKQTGCKYTAINISEKQLMFAEQRVKEAGLQDRIKFLLCDYRQLPPTKKYDRILACEMIEHVGHEYCEEFFSCCDSILAENGLLILQLILAVLVSQFSSIPDPLFHEFRRSPGFVKEFIFPGAYLPSLSRVTAAMAASSRLSVEHVENIGIHYYKTLRCWRMNFLEHQTKILSLGFDEKFIRKWEYYLDYCAAGFKTHTLGNYQIVLSRYGNNVAFNDPFEGILSALSY